MADQDRVAASAGAACHADEVALSSVLRAMQVPEDWGMGTLRLSTGRRLKRHTEINFGATEAKSPPVVGLYIVIVNDLCQTICSPACRTFCFCRAGIYSGPNLVR